MTRKSQAWPELQGKRAFHPLRIALFLGGAALTGIGLYWAHGFYDDHTGLDAVNAFFIAGVIGMGLVFMFGDKVTESIAKLISAIRGKAGP